MNETDQPVEFAGAAAAPLGVEIPSGAPREPDVQKSTGDSAPSNAPAIESPVQIAAELAALRSVFEKRLSYDKTKEDAFDRLYSELEELKKNSANEQLRPLFIDLVLLYDRIESVGQLLAQDNSSSPETASLVKTLGDELIEILSRREAEPIIPLADTFDPSIHRAIGVESVETEPQGGRVARVVRRGFRLGNRILRPEEVIVTKYTAKKPQN